MSEADLPSRSSIFALSRSVCTMSWSLALRSSSRAWRSSCRVLAHVLLVSACCAVGAQQGLVDMRASSGKQPCFQGNHVLHENQQLDLLTFNSSSSSFTSPEKPS